MYKVLGTAPVICYTLAVIIIYQYLKNLIVQGD